MTVIMNYGMGADSTAILLRWMEDPSSRDFDLDEMVVLTAMTGDEFDDTRRLVDTHMLPRFRDLGIRYVQVARADKTESVKVLDDSTSPTKLYIKGAFKLSDELLPSGTLPQVSDVRKCSIHAKGWPLDAWLEKELGDRPFTQVIGFNAKEQRRIDKDRSYGGDRFKNRKPWYPLMDWGWDRETLELYIESVVGEKWQKSCCTYCPFAMGKDPVMLRYRTFPKVGGDALWLEFIALSFNPRQPLYLKKTLYSVVKADKNHAAMAAFQKLVDTTPFAIYHVRRIWVAQKNASRSILKVEDGGRGTLEGKLEKYGKVVVDEHGVPRVTIRPLNKSKFPSLEESYVIAPAIVDDKQKPTFEMNWDALAAGRAVPTAAERRRMTVKKNPMESIGPVFDIDTEEASRKEREDWERQFNTLLSPVEPKRDT